MNYYDELSGIEEQIIRLDSAESILRIAGSADPSHTDAMNTIWLIEGMIVDINEKLSEKFSHLWDIVREDSFAENTIPILSTNDYVAPSKTSNELNSIVNSWVRSEEC